MSASLLLKRSMKTAASIAGIGNRITRKHAGSVHVLAYHRVVADIAKAENEAIYGIVISTETFRRHCEILKQNYEVVSLDDAAAFIRGEVRYSRPVAVITFDDGYADFYTEAFPVLRDLGLTATVFLPTGFIGADKPLAHDRLFWLLKTALESKTSVSNGLERAGFVEPKCDRLLSKGRLLDATDILVHQPDELRERMIAELELELASVLRPYPTEYSLLNWDQVSEMAAAGIDFGSHTVRHVVLSCESQETVTKELSESKAELESRLGRPVSSFAYPNGKVNDIIRVAAVDARYDIAVTTETHMNSLGADLMMLGRTSLCEESTRGILGSYSHNVAALRLGV